MARMEEMMLAHAGAAGEFSIILDAPLPSLQQYRRHPAPPSGASSASSSPFRRGGKQDGVSGGRDERVPARLRHDGSGHDAFGDVRRAADAGTRWEQRPAGSARGEEEEEVGTPLRLANPRSVRRLASRGATPPSRPAEAKRVVAEEAVEEETPRPPPPARGLAVRESG